MNNLKHNNTFIIPKEYKEIEVATNEFNSLLQEYCSIDDINYSNRISFMNEFINPFVKVNLKRININRIDIELLYNYFHDKVHEQRHSKDKTCDFVLGWFLSHLKATPRNTEILNRPHHYDNRTLLQEICYWMCFKSFVMDCLLKKHQLEYHHSGSLVNASDINVDSTINGNHIKVKNGHNCLFLAFKSLVMFNKNENICTQISSKIISLLNHLVEKNEPLLPFLIENNEKGESVYSFLHSSSLQDFFKTQTGQDILDIIELHAPEILLYDNFK